MKLAKKKEQKKKKSQAKGSRSPRAPPSSSMAMAEQKSVSQRSAERRKNIESNRKDNKKMSALDELKAKREEKKKLQGSLHDIVLIIFWSLLVKFWIFIFS